MTMGGRDALPEVGIWPVIGGNVGLARGGGAGAQQFKRWQGTAGRVTLGATTKDFHNLAELGIKLHSQHGILPGRLHPTPNLIGLISAMQLV